MKEILTPERTCVTMEMMAVYNSDYGHCHDRLRNNNLLAIRSQQPKDLFLLV